MTMDPAMGEGSLAPMVIMGLLTSVVAPALVVASRRLGGASGRRAGARRTTGRRAVGILAGFAAVHAAVMLTTAAAHPSMSVHVLSHGVLLAGAVVFWTPVLGRSRLPHAGRALYLFVASPCLDAAALAVIVAGHQTEGLAMIVAMMPVPAAAVASTWGWVVAEENAAGTGVRPEIVEPATGGPS